jgi:hypothetical protein
MLPDVLEVAQMAAAELDRVAAIGHVTTPPIKTVRSAFGQRRTRLQADNK